MIRKCEGVETGVLHRSLQGSTSQGPGQGRLCVMAIMCNYP